MVTTELCKNKTIYVNPKPLCKQVRLNQRKSQNTLTCVEPLLSFLHHRFRSCSYIIKHVSALLQHLLAYGISRTVSCSSGLLWCVLFHVAHQCLSSHRFCGSCRIGKNVQPQTHAVKQYQFYPQTAEESMH